MCKVKKELRSIKNRIGVMNKIMEDANISLIGINDGDSDKILSELVSVLRDTKENSSVLVVTNNTYVQTAYKLRSVLPDKIASLEYRGMISIMLSENNFNIDILNMNSERLTDELILHYDHVIYQIPDKRDIDIKRIAKWSEKNKKTKLVITAECPNGKEIGLLKVLKLRRYVDNVLFMMYDDIEGDVCFVDIFKRKHMLYTVK